jgi:hypothetical protein
MQRFEPPFVDRSEPDDDERRRLENLRLEAIPAFASAIISAARFIDSSENGGCSY